MNLTQKLLNYSNVEMSEQRIDRKIKSVSVPRLNENYKYTDWSIKVVCANDDDYVLHFSNIIDAAHAQYYLCSVNQGVRIRGGCSEIFG